MLQKNNRNKILKIFFDDPLAPGFQLREISRKTKIAPPSVKRYLKELEREGLIFVKPHRIQKFPTYYANRDNDYFKLLKKLDIQHRIQDLLKHLEDSLLPDVV
ncbi:MAG: winged helix-turn-helix transcriptional regulator, partial [Nanoarchaeota archaeon]